MFWQALRLTDNADPPAKPETGPLRSGQHRKVTHNFWITKQLHLFCKIFLLGNGRLRLSWY